MGRRAPFPRCARGAGGGGVESRAPVARTQAPHLRLQAWHREPWEAALRIHATQVRARSSERPGHRCLRADRSSNARGAGSRAQAAGCAARDLPRPHPHRQRPAHPLPLPQHCEVRRSRPAPHRRQPRPPLPHLGRSTAACPDSSSHRDHSQMTTKTKRTTMTKKTTLHSLVPLCGRMCCLDGSVRRRPRCARNPPWVVQGPRTRRHPPSLPGR